MLNVNNESKSTIVDLPLQPGQEDLFDLTGFQYAIVEYIRNANAPLTIALQGDRGSGKTSVMTAIKSELCENKVYSPFYGVWINTWQFSLLNDSHQAGVDILHSMINHIGSLDPESQHYRNIINLLDKLGPVVKRLYDLVGGVVLEKTKKNAIDKIVGVIGWVWKKLTNKEDKYADIDKASLVEKLKAELDLLTKEILNKSNKKQGFIFFIDDLDRVDPALAVDLLELFKNIFDLKSCIFIVAIDHRVIADCLKLKIKSENLSLQDYRFYFEKLFQLQISLPVKYYSVTTFLEKSLQDISFFASKEFDNFFSSTKDGFDHSRDLLLFLSAMVKRSVGYNPRSLKVFINTLSLIDKLSMYSWHKLDSTQSDPTPLPLVDRVLVFILLCIQMAYPFIYKLLLNKQNFLCWDDKFASNLNAPECKVEDIKLIKFLFDMPGGPNNVEDWEVGVFRICHKDAFLINHVVDILFIFHNIIKFFDRAFEFYGGDIFIKNPEELMLNKLGIFLPRVVINNVFIDDVLIS